MKTKQKYFRFYKNWYGICFTPKEEAFFSLRNGYRKSIFLFGWYIYLLKPVRKYEIPTGQLTLPDDGHYNYKFIKQNEN